MHYLVLQSLTFYFDAVPLLNCPIGYSNLDICIGDPEDQAVKPYPKLGNKIISWSKLEYCFLPLLAPLL